MNGIGGRVRELREKKGWSQQALADQSGLSRSTIDKWERGKRGGDRPNLDSLQRIADALEVPLDALIALQQREAGLSRRTFLTSGLATAVASTVVEQDTFDVRGIARTVQELAHCSPSEERHADVSAEVSLSDLALLGVALNRQGEAKAGAALLGYLVDPMQGERLMRTLRERASGADRVTAAVANGHLGHCQLSLGAAPRAAYFFNRALALFAEIEDDQQPLPPQEWERWQRLTGRSPNDFVTWCRHMLGVIKRTSAKRGEVEEAIGLLNYAELAAARGQMSPLLDQANVLRDRAVAKFRLNPQSSEVVSELSESVARLAETDELDMLAMSLLNRATVCKARGETALMERDAATGLHVCPQGAGVVRANALNTAARLYVDTEPALARRLALEARRQAAAGGYAGQLQRTEETLRQLPT